MLLGFATVSAPALAQMSQGAPPPQQAAPQPGPAQANPAQTNPMCVRLEGQLATIDRGAGTGDPAKDDQIRRYQDAAAKQQAELDRVTMQAKRMGCDSSGFFSLFNGQSEKCGPVNTQIQQMRGNLDQITSSLERLRSGGIGGADRENQRRSVLTALAQNNCGPQYAAAARSGATSSIICSATTAPYPAAERRIRSAVRHLPHRLRPHLRRRLFPGLIRDRTRRVSRRRKNLQGAVPGDRSDSVHLPQSRRRHQPGGLRQRPALFGPAERLQIPHRVQPVLRLQGCGPDLVRRVEIGRGSSRGRTAGRYHRHRRERAEDAAARAAAAEGYVRGQEGRGSCRHRDRAAAGSA